MDRATLMSKLGEIENAKNIVDFIMDENGKDIETAKAKVREEFSDYEQTKTDLAEKAAELQKFEKDGELYIDREEYSNLVKFKQETEQQAELSQKTKAITELLKSNNANEKAVKLLTKAIKLDEVEFEESDGQLTIKNGSKVLEGLKSEYADFFVTNTESGGAKSTTPPAEATDKSTAPLTLQDALKEKYNET